MFVKIIKLEFKGNQYLFQGGAEISKEKIDPKRKSHSSSKGKNAIFPLPHSGNSCQANLLNWFWK